MHQTRNGYSNAKANFTVNLDEFLEFCRVDLRLSKKTIVRNRSVVRRVLQECGPDPSTPQLRQFLGKIENDSTRDNYIKGLRTYFRDYKNDFERVRTFRLANRIVIPSWCPSKKDLQVFYSELGDSKERAIFLMYASSGKRRNEVLELTLKDVDIADRVIYPNKESCSKRTWYSFFNQECQDVLYEYLKVRRDPSRCGKLFPLGSQYDHCLFKIAQNKTNLPITPKVLRLWFCCEMSRLGVSDRFIDAFCGRVPRSVFARHYTDYSLETLKEIYDKAGLKVLS